MALLPDKITLKRTTVSTSVCYTKHVYEYADSGDILAPGGPTHSGTPELLCCCVPRCGFDLDFGSDAGLGVEGRPACCCMCEEYGITAGAKSAKKAQLLLPSFCTRLFDCLAMCGSKLVLRVREDGSSEDKWHIRTLPECCASHVMQSYIICKPGSTVALGTIILANRLCCCATALGAVCNIGIDFPSGDDPCSVASKHAILSAAMVIDRYSYAPISFSCG
ncbi:hypothetical protein FNF28_07611 [Cafeteria roenbergensis]|uniref:Phospholipid scramblase n=1 Tax=Cafeteria roenbergensis TaxID=33653 RepID=A0A5A8C4F9_CAFRO|nr:hypothetical protein FNF28_07611 [Cafeteria roenbergensis]